MPRAVEAPGIHLQRVESHGLGGIEPLHQVVFISLVHEETHAAIVHAVDRHLEVHEPVQGFQHEAIAAEGDDHVGLIRITMAVAAFQPVERLLGARRVGGDESDGFGGHGRQPDKRPLGISATEYNAVVTGRQPRRSIRVEAGRAGAAAQESFLGG